MNNERRKEIDRIISELQGLLSNIDDVLSEEQDAYDNMPEGLQQSERGEAGSAVAILRHLLTAYDVTQEVISCLENAKE